MLKLNDCSVATSAWLSFVYASSRDATAEIKPPCIGCGLDLGKSKSYAISEEFAKQLADITTEELR